MTNTPKAANDAGKSPLTVAEQVLNRFYDALSVNPDLKEVAERFRQEQGRNDAAMKKILFGDQP